MEKRQNHRHAIRLNGDNLLIFGHLPSPLLPAHHCARINVLICRSCIFHSFIHSFTWFNTKMRFVHMLCVYICMCRCDDMQGQRTRRRTRAQSIQMENSSWDGFFRFSGFLYSARVYTFYTPSALTHTFSPGGTHMNANTQAQWCHPHSHLAIYCSMQIKYLAPSNLLAGSANGPNCVYSVFSLSINLFDLVLILSSNDERREEFILFSPIACDVCRVRCVCVCAVCVSVKCMSGQHSTLSWWL